MYEVKEKLDSGSSIDHMTYTWDGTSHEVTVYLREENVGFSWPVPRWEPGRSYAQEFSQLPERVQKALIEARETGETIDLGKAKEDT